MTKYSRVTYAQRCQISAFLQAKVPVAQMAKNLNLHKTTIYRELKRNSFISKLCDPAEYCPTKAENKARFRFKSCKRKLKITGELEELIVSLLQKYWTPEQISGRLRRERRIKISHQAIYNFIRTKAQYACYLRYQGKRFYRHNRNNKKNNTHWKVHISKRPAGAENRSRIGHWERDLMYGKDRSPVLVCTDRKTRFTKLAAVERATIEKVSEKTHILLDSVGKRVISVTNDNGLEFSSSNSIKYPTYFCDPYRPQQRGTVENTIGVIRRFIKKNSDLSLFNLDDIETWLNFRPRKVLDYQCPYEVFYGKSVALAI